MNDETTGAATNATLRKGGFTQGLPNTQSATTSLANTDGCCGDSATAGSGCCGEPAQLSTSPVAGVAATGGCCGDSTSSSGCCN